MYRPAFTRREGASPGAGFSTNRVIREPSIATTPNALGSGTSWSAIVARAPRLRWNARNLEKSRESITSPLYTAKVPSIRDATFFTAPPVPRGVASSTTSTLLPASASWKNSRTRSYM